MEPNCPWLGLLSLTVSPCFLIALSNHSLLPLFMLVKTEFHSELLLLHFPDLSLYMFLFPVELIFLGKVGVFYVPLDAELCEVLVLFDVFVGLSLNM